MNEPMPGPLYPLEFDLWVSPLWEGRTWARRIAADGRRQRRRSLLPARAARRQRAATRAAAAALVELTDREFGGLAPLDTFDDAELLHFLDRGRMRLAALHCQETLATEDALWPPDELTSDDLSEALGRRVQLVHDLTVIAARLLGTRLVVARRLARADDIWLLAFAELVRVAWGREVPDELSSRRARPSAELVAAR